VVGVTSSDGFLAVQTFRRFLARKPTAWLLMTTSADEGINSQVARVEVARGRIGVAS